jgi:hypothetical protein
MFQKEIVVSVLTLVRNKGYRSILGIRNEVRVTIEAFTFFIRNKKKYQKNGGLI